VLAAGAHVKALHAGQQAAGFALVEIEAPHQLMTRPRLSGRLHGRARLGALHIEQAAVGGHGQVRRDCPSATGRATLRANRPSKSMRVDVLIVVVVVVVIAVPSSSSSPVRAA
jgi:hypothetical protein